MGRKHLTEEVVEDAAIGALIAIATGNPVAQGATVGAATAVGVRAARRVAEEVGLDDLFESASSFVDDLFDF